jgi:hypothetical protein
MQSFVESFLRVACSDEVEEFGPERLAGDKLLRTS